MSEIEKMYENAGIEPIAEYCKHQCNNEFDDNACIGCKYIEKVEYPPFTAEKQLKLIKWLVCTGEEIRISGHRKGDLYWISTDVDNKEQESTFEETLAKLVNNIWQYLTEGERKQIKEILEGCKQQ